MAQDPVHDDVLSLGETVNRLCDLPYAQCMAMTG